ncbi:MAG: WG repeat-containing protein [Nostoc sp. DedQUE08]|uniref:WG repeat-containing protein n=1 Tax=unclassified Nostoc TaxID=2593658 RepID=UPI002AD3534D|nr:MULTISPECIES: WG repeat-containing protein [unclassified Nostoc]MDZ8069153.1 WG repeat-containing protein [Nostoc sp. DedQUE08]MDZ8090327.1 WG repeat-containing protein [Nostoc sp. DedQUE05]
MIGYILRQRYKIIQKLGAGGFGETYLAEYPQDLPVTPKYKCVIKRLTKPQTPDIDTVERFKKEAAILFTLGKEHLQIPQLYDFLDEYKEFYLIQEYIDGHDLSNEITSGKPWSEADVIQLLQDILEVLAFVHEQNVIHRDIKPLNLMRRYSDNKLVLIDFGTIKEISTSGINSQGKISTTMAIGTRGYMPNEQWEGHPQLCSDIYALGVTAIQALTGLPPQQLPKSKTLELIWRDCAQVSDGLADFLTKMVRRDFHQRYKNANEAMQALNHSGLRLAPSPESSPKPIKIGEKYGYINKTGKVIIQPQFDKAWQFYQGLALVKIGSEFSYGYINKIGQLIILPQFKFASNFYEGLAEVLIAGKCGYIDKSGQLVISPKFDETLGFSEGIAVVKINGKWGYIDKSDKLVIQPQFDEAGSFSEGIAAVKINDKWGYTDKIGQLVIQPQFDESWDFYEGLAMVKINDKWGYINRVGQLVIPPQFEDHALLSQGIFSEGLAAVNMGYKFDYKFAYIDKSGGVVIEPMFDVALKFSEGLAAVNIGDKWGYIDKIGQLVIQPQFDSANEFSEGLAEVKLGKQDHYIDKIGKLIY